MEAVSADESAAAIAASNVQVRPATKAVDTMTDEEVGEFVESMDVSGEVGSASAPVSSGAATAAAAVRQPSSADMKSDNRIASAIEISDDSEEDEEPSGDDLKRSEKEEEAALPSRAYFRAFLRSPVLMFFRLCVCTPD